MQNLDVLFIFAVDYEKMFKIFDECCLLSELETSKNTLRKIHRLRDSYCRNRVLRISVEHVLSDNYRNFFIEVHILKC